MNERIKELERQADEYADGLGLAGDEWCDAQSTRFAELIVRECTEVIDAQKPVWQNTDVPASVALDLASKNVKAYFGVK